MDNKKECVHEEKEVGMWLLFQSAWASDSDLLFVGNSYTSANNLAVIVEGLLEEGAFDSVDVSALTGGGLRFVNHLSRTQNNSSWSSAFSSFQNWTIFQEQSQIPGFPQTEAMWIESLDAFLSLDELVAQQGGESVLMMTWGRRDGDSQNTWLYPDFETMQELLQDGYLRYASTASSNTRKVWVAPVGEGFAQIKIQHPQQFSQLYTNDGSHPSYNGSYLAACILYSTLTGRSSVGLQTGAPSNHTAIYQEIAEGVVLAEPFGDFPYPWAWTELPIDGMVQAEGMRPQLRYNEDSNVDIVVDDSIIMIEGGTVQGKLYVASNASATISEGVIQGNIEGDVTMRGGRLESATITGSLVQETAGTIVLDALIVTGDAHLSQAEVVLAEGVDYGRLEAGTLQVENLQIDSELNWSVSEEENVLEVWRETGVPEPEGSEPSSPTNEPESVDTAEPEEMEEEEMEVTTDTAIGEENDPIESEDSATKASCQHIPVPILMSWMSLFLILVPRLRRK